MAESSEAGEVLVNNGHISSQEEQVDVWIGTTLEEDCELSSSVHVEMEAMNSASSTINKLSAELEMAKSRYSIHLRQSVEYIKKLEKDSTKSLERAKPFYTVYKEARELQDKCRHAAVLFERASQQHQAAKEVVAIAETELFKRTGDCGTMTLDSAWQETLSHGVEKVNVTESAKRESEAEHLRLTATLKHVMERYRVTEIKLRKYIRKAHHFYLERNRCNIELKTMRESVQKLTGQLAAQRKEYNAAMRNLEQISEEIHRHRSFSHRQGGVRGKYQDEVSALEAQAGLAGLNITEDPRASDEHIHYRPDEVDNTSRMSESSSLQLDDESHDSEFVGDCSVPSFECNGEVEDSFTLDRHGQSPLLHSTCAQVDKPHQTVTNGEVHEVPEESASDREVPSESTPDREMPSQSTPDREVPSESTPDREVPSESTPDREVPSESTPDREMPSEIISEDTLVLASASTDTLTAVSKEDLPADREGPVEPDAA